MSEATSLQLERDDALIVEWQDGRYAGKTTPAVLARNIIEPNLRDISVGSQLKIKMGKSSSAKVWNAVFVGKKTEDEGQRIEDTDTASGKHTTDEDTACSWDTASSKDTARNRDTASSKDTTRNRDTASSKDTIRNRDTASTKNSKRKKLACNQESAAVELIIGDAASVNLSDDGEDKDIVMVDCEHSQSVQNEILTRLKHIEDILEMYVVPLSSQYNTTVHYDSSVQHSSNSSSRSGSIYTSTPYRQSSMCLQQATEANEMDAFLSSIDLGSMTGLGSNQSMMAYSSNFASPTGAPVSSDTIPLCSHTASPELNMHVETAIETKPEASAETKPEASAETKPEASSPEPTDAVTEPSDSLLYQKLGLSPNLVKVINREANSRQNLASKLVKKVYSKKERDTCNVHGRKGKKRLDPERMSLVQQLTYHLRPLKPGENEAENWRKTCVVAIDTANRKDKD